MISNRNNDLEHINGLHKKSNNDPALIILGSIKDQEKEMI